MRPRDLETPEPAPGRATSLATTTAAPGPARSRSGIESCRPLEVSARRGALPMQMQISDGWKNTGRWPSHQQPLQQPPRRPTVRPQSELAPLRLRLPRRRVSSQRQEDPARAPKRQASRFLSVRDLVGALLRRTSRRTRSAHAIELSDAATGSRRSTISSNGSRTRPMNPRRKSRTKANWPCAAASSTSLP